MSSKLEAIKEEVKALHDTSTDECMRIWFYEGHVALVARNAQEIAEKMGCNVEISVLASLFHDIARTWGIKDEPELMNESLVKTEELMKKHGYSDDEVEQVKQAILPHSCLEKAPHTNEGKVLATADALAHLLSDFYFILPFYGWLTAAKDFEGYRSWLLKKIERDMHKQIFWDEYKDRARPKYEAMKTAFISS
jgi:HD superfamily phosphodiesterase